MPGNPLLDINNLSDVSDTVTARENLNVDSKEQGQARVDALVNTLAEPDGAKLIGRISTIADLRSTEPTIINQAMDVITYAGTTYLGRDTGGRYSYAPTDSSTADNDGTVIVTPSGKRYKRIYNGPLYPEWFGVKGDGVSDDTEGMQAAFDAAAFGVLILSSSVKYRCGNLKINQPFTLQASSRRQNVELNPLEGLSGDFIEVVTMISPTFLGITLSGNSTIVDENTGEITSPILNGVTLADNSGDYQTAIIMHNCNINRFSGYCLWGGRGRNFAELNDCQIEYGGQGCINIQGVDWRLLHVYTGNSITGNGITISESNYNIIGGAVYENHLGHGIEVLGDAANGIICNNDINGNGKHGIYLHTGYGQHQGHIIGQNVIWNNSKSSDGVFDNIHITGVRSVALAYNQHFAYQAAAGSTATRANYCIGIEGTTTLSLLTDLYDAAYSYRTDFINIRMENIINNNSIEFGTRSVIKKFITASTTIGLQLWVSGELFPRIEITGQYARFGDGTTQPKGLGCNPVYIDCLTTEGKFAVPGTYDKYLRLRSYRFWQDNAGNIRYNKDSDPADDTNSTISSNLYLTLRVSVPSSSSANGLKGNWAADDNYLYVYGATRWRRIAVDNTW